MNEQLANAPGAPRRTTVEPRGDRELVVTRTFDASPAAVYRAWSQPEMFRSWWMPRSVEGISLQSCDLDVRTGGKYRLEFRAGETESMAFHGRYIEVVPNQRIVWTNDEDEEGAVTTLTFAETGGKTMLTFHESYPTTEARDEAFEGSAAALPEQLDQLADFLSGADKS